jgi:hypothetical protein
MNPLKLSKASYFVGHSSCLQMLPPADLSPSSVSFSATSVDNLYRIGMIIIFEGYHHYSWRHEKSA